MKSYKYYHLVGTDKATGKDVIHFGSFDKEDVEYELEAQRDELKEDGYKKIRLVATRIPQAPDPSVYGKEFCREAERTAK